MVNPSQQRENLAGEVWPYEIPESVSPEGLEARARIMRQRRDEACARHLELAAAKIRELTAALFATEREK